MKPQTISKIIWIGTFLVYLLPMLKWGSELDWQIDELNLLSIFPLLGLWAFAQMWQHYAVGALKRRQPDAFDYKAWYRATGNVVLALIFLHPLLLVADVVPSGQTPFDYVSSDQLPYLLAAYFALACFIAYELAERLQKSKFWQKNFGLIVKLNYVAMFAIFAHSLMLGGDLEEGWLRAIWLVMLVGFIALIFDSYQFKKKSQPNLSD